MGALALILELYHAVCDGSIRKGTLGGSRCNSTVIIIG